MILRLGSLLIMHRLLVRALPALGVLTLLALAAAAPPRMMPQPPPPLVCDLPLVVGDGDGIVDFQSDLGLIQPLPPGFAAAACSLGIQGLDWTTGRVNLVQWDPLTLAQRAMKPIRSSATSLIARVSHSVFAFALVALVSV